MPCSPYFIRVPAAPCMVQGGGPGPGNALMGWCGSVQGDVAWLNYGVCMCVVSRGGKDGQQAGWRQQPLQDTALLPYCKTLSQCDSFLSRERASHGRPCQGRLLTTLLSPAMALQQRARGAPQPAVGLPAGGVSPGPRAAVGSSSGTRALAAKGGWSQAGS